MIYRSYPHRTTGNPKGVLLTHYNACCTLNSYTQVDLSEKLNIVNRTLLSYLPLAHSYERIVNIASLLDGTQVGFWCNDITMILDDMQQLKPLTFFGVPRIFQKFQDGINDKINKSNFLVKAIYNYASKAKLNAILNRKEPNKLFERILFNKFKQPFGGRIKFCGSGAAPLSKEAALFLKVHLFEYVGEGYGLTETCTGGTGTSSYDIKYGHVG